MIRRFRAALLAAALLLPAWSASAQPDLVARGRYLVEGIAGCGNCHTPKGPQGDLPGRNRVGGMVIEEPAFRVIGPNITPDPETGIGRWTDAQIVRAVTEGVSADGRRLFPPMGYGYYARMTPSDLADLVAYLRSLPALP